MFLSEVYVTGRVRSVFWAFWRGWLFGVVLGLVLGGGLGTFFIPVLGTIYGGVIGAVLGAITGLGAALLVAPAALFPPSVVLDRVWPGVVAAGVTYVLITEVVFSRTSFWDDGDAPYFCVLVVGAGGLAMVFGAAVTRGVRIRFMRTPVVVLGGIVGALSAVCRVVAEEGLGEPGMLAGLAVAGGIVGGILGAVMVVFNLLVTKEPAAE